MAFRSEGFSDYSRSAFQPDESRAEQVARANDHGRHAACFLTSSRIEASESKSSCRTRRAGHGRGSSLTLGMKVGHRIAKELAQDEIVIWAERPKFIAYTATGHPIFCVLFLSVSFFELVRQEWAASITWLVLWTSFSLALWSQVEYAITNRRALIATLGELKEVYPYDIEVLRERRFAPCVAAIIVKVSIERRGKRVSIVETGFFGIRSISTVKEMLEALRSGKRIQNA